MTNVLCSQFRAGDVVRVYTTEGIQSFIVEPGGVPGPSTNHQVFVSAVYGSDTAGNGSQSAPYATIAHAQSTVVGASSTSMWQIVLLPGYYYESPTLLPFTELLGWDPSQTRESYYTTQIFGILQLGLSFAVTDARAYVTNLAVAGGLIADFVAAGSTDGSISATSCHFAGDTILTMGTDNEVEFHESHIGGSLTQSGGAVKWYNTNGTGTSALLHVSAAAGTGATFDAWGGSWSGDVSADQNGITDEAVTLELHGFSASNGTVTVVAVGARCPTINADVGALPDNPILDGSAAMALTRHMRVTQKVKIVAGTAIGGAGVTDLITPFAGGVLGATSIEDLISQCTLVGVAWDTILQSKACTVNFAFIQNGLTPEIHCYINNVDAGFNTVADLYYIYDGFYPSSVP